jgi:D-alanyl-D-alanine carboxypeptidase/D-alanyl-D-alanine-endopeptidase (penicillin-binding protein 4)
MRSLNFTSVLVGFLLVTIVACSPSSFISKEAKNNLLHSTELEHAHVGIAIYDASAHKSIYNYQSNKYFIPASNTKLFSCYAAMKYLGDSLPGIYYTENDTAVYLMPSGDPTLLHQDFLNQPVINFLKSSHKKIYISARNWKENALGYGWSWDDYNSDYMAERSPLPVYGNVIKWVQERDSTQKNDGGQFNNPVSIYSLPEVNWKVRFNPESNNPSFYVKRNREENEFVITEGKELKKVQDVPFFTNTLQSAIELLADTIGREIFIAEPPQGNKTPLKLIRSQPLDSFLIPMMHRSDNFFAEQSLLMVSQQLLGFMSTSRIIDSLIKTDLNALPQKPRWVDGSGLSRYNLFTPDDFVWLLNKMKDEFGMDRLKKILATGGTGTLSNFFKEDSGFLYAKTGTLSGQVALSGFLYTKKNKLVIFSLLVGNHNAPAVAIRRQTEAFIHAIRDRY